MTKNVNTATVGGEVLKIRSFGDYVLIHLLDPDDTRLNVAYPISFPLGTLLPGDYIYLKGWLQDIPYWETLRGFLQRARKSRLLKRLDAFLEITVERSLTAVVSEEPPSIVDKDEIMALKDNRAARVSGVISRAWSYSRHAFVRLAIYDEHCHILPNGKQVAHYVTAQFTNSQVSGREIKTGKNNQAGILCPKQHIQVAGHLINRNYVENLRTWLKRIEQADEIRALVEEKEQVSTKVYYGQVLLEVEQMLQFL